MKTLTIISLIIIIQSCSTRSEDIEVDVINDVFLELVGMDYYLEPFPIAPYRPIHPDSLEYELESDEPLVVEFEGETDTFEIDNEELRKKEIDEYENFDWAEYYREVEEFEYKLKNRKQDTSRLVVLFSDTLITVRKTRLLKSILTEEGFKRNFEVDTTWRSLAVKLVDSISQPQKIKLSEITLTGRYNLESVYEYEKNDVERVVGSVTFSRIAFNDKMNKGCFYYSFVCGGECGDGVLFFIRKLNGKWVIEGARQLWVS